MKELGSMDVDQMKQRIDMKVEMFQILDEEELFWFKRCHETWLLKWDNNTEFFHMIANGRRRKKTIFSLQDGDVTISGTEDLLTHATSYYKSLFGLGNGNACGLRNDLWHDEEKVTEGSKKATRGRGEWEPIKIHRGELGLYPEFDLTRLSSSSTKTA
jgi:hypothetical protein